MPLRQCCGPGLWSAPVQNLWGLGYCVLCSEDPKLTIYDLRFMIYDLRPEFSGYDFADARPQPP
jgi:hypothetical protein